MIYYYYYYYHCWGNKLNNTPYFLWNMFSLWSRHGPFFWCWTGRDQVGGEKLDSLLQFMLRTDTWGPVLCKKRYFFVGDLWICNNQHLPPPTWSFATMMIFPTNTWFFSTSMILSQQHMIFSHQHDPFLPKCCLIYSVNSSTMIYGKILENSRKNMPKICPKMGS